MKYTYEFTVKTLSELLGLLHSIVNEYKESMDKLISAGVDLLKSYIGTYIQHSLAWSLAVSQNIVLRSPSELAEEVVKGFNSIKTFHIEATFHYLYLKTKSALIAADSFLRVAARKKESYSLEDLDEFYNNVVEAKREITIADITDLVLIALPHIEQALIDLYKYAKKQGLISKAGEVSIMLKELRSIIKEWGLKG